MLINENVRREFKIYPLDGTDCELLEESRRQEVLATLNSKVNDSLISLSKTGCLHELDSTKHYDCDKCSFREDFCQELKTSLETLLYLTGRSENYLITSDVITESITMI